MSENEIPARPRWIAPMRPRSPEEAHRVATPLELLFDLVIVVAVARAAAGLHHGIAEGHIVDTLISYTIVFFGIWWAWIGFTWFASAYDNDDILYRLLVFAQMTGALILAAGVESVFAERDLTFVIMGYVVMRVALITLYLRAAQSDPAHRQTELRYALGIGLAQVAWVLLLFLPQALQVPLALVGVLVELVIPAWAESAAPTTWHPHHIRERYGLFTIIVLGESILSTSVGIQTAFDSGGLNISFLSIAIGGLLIVYSLWWLYFYQPMDHLAHSIRATFVWGYGHLLIFAATAAVGAGLAVVIDQFTHHAEISATTAGMAVAIPVAVYVVSLWVLHEHPRSENGVDRLVHPLAVILILLTPFTGQAVLLTGLLLVLLVAVRLIRRLE